MVLKKKGRDYPGNRGCCQAVSGSPNWQISGWLWAVSVFSMGSADFVGQLGLLSHHPTLFAMASNLRLPMAVPRNISQSTLGSVQSRSFSQSSQQWAGGRAVNFRPPSVAQPSFKTRTKDMKPSDLPNDIGLLPGTFVRPLWRDMPSIFQQPRERLHMEWTWMKSVFSNYTRSVMSCTKQEHVLINE